MGVGACCGVAALLQYLPSYSHITNVVNYSVAGGQTVNVVGHGLRASAEYRCRFSHPVFGTVVSELSRPFGAFNLQCQTPAIPVGACLAVSVDELRGGSLAPLAATAAGGSRVAIVAQALVSGVTPASITTDGGAVVTVSAAGLDPQGVYVCRHRACSIVVWLCGCVAGCLRAQ